jgi:hypothetical protein
MLSRKTQTAPTVGASIRITQWQILQGPVANPQIQATRAWSFYPKPMTKEASAKEFFTAHFPRSRPRPWRNDPLAGTSKSLGKSRRTEQLATQAKAFLVAIVWPPILLER